MRAGEAPRVPPSLGKIAAAANVAENSSPVGDQALSGIFRSRQTIHSRAAHSPDIGQTLTERLRRVMTPQVPYDQLAWLAHNLAVCTAAGLGAREAVATATRQASSPVVKRLGAEALMKMVDGQELSAALRVGADYLPPFFLPVIECGEQSGRLDEALRYLHHHCRLLDEPTRILRRTWLVPLMIFIACSAFTVAAYFYLESFEEGLTNLFRTIRNYLILALVALVVAVLPGVKRYWDRLRLALPVIGEADREIAVDRFFHALHLLYASGDMRVEQMIQLAADTVDNQVLRADFLQAARLIEQRATIGDAFRRIDSLNDTEKATIDAGDLAGSLEDAFETICRQAAQSAQHRLRMFQALFFRVVLAATAGATMITVVRLALA